MSAMGGHCRVSHLPTQGCNREFSRIMISCFVFLFVSGMDDQALVLELTNNGNQRLIEHYSCSPDPVAKESPPCLRTVTVTTQLAQAISGLCHRFTPSVIQNRQFKMLQCLLSLALTAVCTSLPREEESQRGN